MCGIAFIRLRKPLGYYIEKYGTPSYAVNKLFLYHLGDWYFTGNYPTSGGNRVANRSFINFMEGKKERAY